MAGETIAALPGLDDLHGRRVTVMGLGSFGGGAGVTRFLASRGARVLVTDRRPAADLRASLETLDGLDVETRLGEHRATDFTDTDLVIANPAVPPNAPLLELARENGVPVESEISLFFRHCPAPIIGITGSNGKTTTTTLMGDIFRACGRTTHVGGNIGGSILERIGSIDATDTVVLELSSFQGEELDRIGRSPSCSVVLNLSPNHLDRHGSMEKYARAKFALLAHQEDDDIAILSRDDDEVWSWSRRAAGRVYGFSTRRELDEGFFLRGDRIVARLDGVEQDLLSTSAIKILGEFNQANVLAALAPAVLARCAEGDIGSAIGAFAGVAHRLELVAEIDGIRFYNDSIATTPESTLAALEAVDGPKWLIVGGYDKKLSLAGLARMLVERATGVALIGETAPVLARAMARTLAASPAAHGPQTRVCGDLESALQWIVNRPALAGAVLLSPACASYDQFANFAERGEAFRTWVRARALHGARATASL